MSRLVAFLRGINLGDRRLKMDRLRGHFEELDFDDVATFLASGNVVFDHPGSDLAELEEEIERHLESELGFPVDTFVRPLAELVEMAGSDVLAGADEDGFTPHVIFLRHRAGEEIEEGLDALETPDDRFHVAGRAVYWLRRGRLSDSPISTRDLDAALRGSENTMRNLNTVRRIASRFGGSRPSRPGS